MRRARIQILAAIGLSIGCALNLAGCITIPPEVLQELDPPQPGQPNNFPPQADPPAGSARSGR
jgi:hypothetical protein